MRVIGRERVEGVEVEDAAGSRRVVDCDTVVFTGGWIPDHELVRLGGIDLDPATLGPRVDSALRTSRPGVFGAGNLLHPVDTADVAALDGGFVASSVRRWLDTREAFPSGARIVADEPFRWVAPSLLAPGAPAPPRGRLLLWSDEHRPAPRVAAYQDGIEVGRVRTPWPLSPGRVFRLPWSLVSSASPRGGEIRIRLV